MERSMWIAINGNKTRSFICYFKSQAPEVPDLAHQDIFQLSRLSVNCYAYLENNTTVNKLSKLKDWMKLSIYTIGKQFKIDEEVLV